MRSNKMRDTIRKSLLSTAAMFAVATIASMQLASDGGKMDLFPAWTGAGTAGGAGAFGTTAQVMGIFDGNTVTAFWNYAQNYAMSDNMWGDTFGPSTPGLLNMFAGQTNGIVVGAGNSSNALPDGQGGVTLIGDIDPTFDVCSSKTSNVSLAAKNIGDLLNTANVPWGSFYGGFNLQTVNANGTSGCARSTVSPVIGVAIPDYIPHHIWNQYFTSTANPNHLRPTSTKAIGHSADRRGQPDQLPAGAAGLGVHRCDHHLRRLGRLV